MPARPEDESGAVAECTDAEWGDARRTQRWLELTTVFAHRPGASLPEACGDRARLKAAERFVDQEAIDPQAILESPVRATSDRLAQGPRVLAVQETTERDGTAHPATTGLGPLAHPAHPGLLVPTTRALPPERLPWGRRAQQVWARDPATSGQRTTRQQRPIAATERQQWLTSVAAVREAPTRGPQTHWVCIGARAADG